MEDILIDINNIGLKFLQPLSVKETEKVILTQAVQLLHGDWGGLYLEKNDTLEKSTQYPESLELPFTIRKNGFTYKSYLKREIFVISEEEIRRIHPELDEFPYVSALTIPLADHEKSIGTLLVLSKEKQVISPRHKELLQLFGSYASLAIRKAKLGEEREQALEMRDFFISMAAHELRTPLTAVNGYIQLLYKKLENAQGNESKWIKNLLWESQRLTLLINELLEVDQIKKGQFHFRWDFKHMLPIIERATSNLSFIFPKRKITFQNNLKESDMFIGDFDKILQALTNVLENAAKFSKPDTEIILALTSDDKNLLISVQDFGSGIPEEIIPKLFEGYTVHQTSEIQGMGLGLYLVKNILKLHHGEVRIQTKEGEGTTITLVLPKADQA